MNSPLVPPWQDPEQEDFWRSRPEEQRLSVKLSQGATEAIWRLYKTVRYGFVPLTFEGEISGNGAVIDSHEEAVEFCRAYRAFVFNLHRRKAWRLSWGVPKIEQREKGNARFEPVEVMGYKGLSDQWIDRPRVKLFANDF
jgi:hypothetical protein